MDGEMIALRLPTPLFPTMSAHVWDVPAGYSPKNPRKTKKPERDVMVSSTICPAPGMSLSRAPRLPTSRLCGGWCVRKERVTFFE